MQGWALLVRAAARLGPLSAVGTAAGSGGGGACDPLLRVVPAARGLGRCLKACVLDLQQSRGCKTSVVPFVGAHGCAACTAGGGSSCRRKTSVCLSGVGHPTRGTEERVRDGGGGCWRAGLGALREEESRSKAAQGRAGL